MTITTTETTRTETSDLHKATARDLPEIVDVLTAAFYDDPIFRWCEPRDDHRKALEVPLFDMTAGAIVPLGESFVKDGGAAIWVPPGPSDPEGEAALYGELLQAVGPEAERTVRFAQFLAESAPTAPHAHLQWLGTRPELQGAGIGSALLRTTLRRFDERGVATYLEATSPVNRRLYERHGFVCRRELVFEDAPPLYAMWRDPQPVS